MQDEKTTKPSRPVRFVVRAEEAGKRLDVLLAERIAQLSRRRARVLIAAGSVSVDGGRLLVASRRLAAGREVICHLGAFVSGRPEALDSERVLYEDAWLIAIDKPAGVPSHPTWARREGTALQLVEELLRRRAGEKVPIWPLHRLDAGTSGILLFAKSRAAARAVSQSFARRRIRKLYFALVEHEPIPSEGEIRLGVAEGTLRSSPSAEGKESVTRYGVVDRLPTGVLLRVEPLTGRMHQIRVHLAAIGHPVLGDTTYACRGAAQAPRLFLHAARIELLHPDTGSPLIVESAIPRDWFSSAAARGARSN